MKPTNRNILTVLLLVVLLLSAVPGYVRAQDAITASRQALAASRQTQAALEDCSIPGGKCYARNQAHTAQAVSTVVAGSSANQALLLQVQASLARITAALRLSASTAPTATQTRPGVASKPTPSLRAKVVPPRPPPPRPVEHLIPGLAAVRNERGSIDPYGHC